MSGGGSGGGGRPFGAVLDAWGFAVAASGAIVATVAAFVTPPPFDLGSVGMLPALAKFMVAIVVAAVIAPFLRLKANRYTAYWSAATIAVLVIGLTILFSYLDTESRFVRHHLNANRTVIVYVISGKLTPTGQAIFDSLVKSTNAPPSDEDLLAHTPASATNLFSDKVYTDWGREAVTAVELRLAALYLGQFVALGSLVILAAQSLRCATAK